MTRAGIVTVVGKPNAGKSTLLNRLIGEKLSITSEKPQSTRNRIVGILSQGEVQMIILDTPGLLEPRYALQRAMRATALQALEDADVIVYLADAKDGAPPPLTEAAQLPTELRAPTLVVLNKIDTLDETSRERLRVQTPGAIQLSARTGEGVEELIQAITPHLPES